MNIQDSQIVIRMTLPEMQTLLHVAGNVSENYMYQTLGMQEEDVRVIQDFYHTFKSLGEIDHED